MNRDELTYTREWQEQQLDLLPSEMGLSLADRDDVTLLPTVPLWPRQSRRPRIVGPAFGYSPEGTPRTNTSLLYPDPIQGRVYSFENAFAPSGRRINDMVEAARIVEEASKELFVEPVPVTRWNNYTPAFEFDHQSGEPKRILVPQYGIATSTLVHEATHSAAIRAFKRETHGPLFLALVIKAYAKVFSMNEDALRREAMREGLPILPTAPWFLSALRRATTKAGGALDVEGWVEFLKAQAVSGEARAYYEAFPESEVLTARVNDLYETFKKKEADDGHQQEVEGPHAEAPVAYAGRYADDNALPFTLDGGPVANPTDEDGRGA
jgi:hypothetical protein